MSTEHNRTLIHRLMDEGFNQGKLEVLEEILTPDYHNHDPRMPQPITNREGMKGFVSYLRHALPDVHFTVDDTVAEGDRVAYRWTATGTQQGEFFGAPPTGRPINVGGIIIARVDGEQIAEEWPVWDALGMLQQLGLVPQPEAAPA
jgi:steroid delta-isomerase-like uncharacterized protein